MPENDYEDLLVQLHDLGGLYQDAEEVIRALLAERADLRKPLSDVWDECVREVMIHSATLRDGMREMPMNPYRRQNNPDVVYARHAEAHRRRDADVWDAGFDAGEADVFQHEADGWDGQHGDQCIPNPYRDRSDT